MKTSEINILLKKYFDAETTIEEENELLQNFKGDAHSDLYELKDMFNLIHDSKFEVISNTHFDNSFREKISSKKVTKVFRIPRKLFYVITGVAASIIIIIGIISMYDSNNNKIEFKQVTETQMTEEQMKNYENTKKALIYVSSKLNNELEKLNKLSVFYEYQQVIKKKGKKV